MTLEGGGVVSGRPSHTKYSVYGCPCGLQRRSYCVGIRDIHKLPFYGQTEPIRGTVRSAISGFRENEFHHWLIEQFPYTPRPICNPRRHRRGLLDRAVYSAKVVIGKVECQRRAQILPLLAEPLVRRVGRRKHIPLVRFCRFTCDVQKRVQLG